MDVYVENAYKEYNGYRVLDIDTLKIKDGYIYALLGLNGSGKSTLLECISGINSLTGGKISYGEGLQIDSVRYDISIMTQKPYLFNTTVMGNIVSGLKFRKLSEEEISKRVEKYLSYFDMKDLLYKNSKKLSGGEGAKTALLRTAVLQTDLTLLDEPTSSLDIESTFKAEELIKDISSNGRTVIVVTHDLYQAERIADYIIFMDRGRVIEMGEKNKILNKPEHKLVKLILNM